jgi:hypothetical protein
VLTALVPHELLAVTVIFPFCPVRPVVAVIEVVPAPDVTVQPVGMIQVYRVEFGTADML